MNSIKIPFLILLLNILDLRIIECAATIYGETSPFPLPTSYIRAGNKNLIEKTINKGADVNHIYDFGETALMRAATYADKDVVELLIKSGANIDAADDEGDTALMLAINWGKEEIVKSLLRAGANIEHVNGYGQNAIEIAKQIEENARKDYRERISIEQDPLEIANYIIQSPKKAEIIKILEDEPARRADLIQKWLMNNLSDKAKNVTSVSKEISNATQGKLFPDIAKIIAEYNIEYNDLPLNYRLAG